MSAVREHFSQTEGVKLRVLDSGEGPAVVLCHGFPGLVLSFEKLANTLVAAGYRVIAVDMLGYGGSDAPTDLREYVYDRITAGLINVLDELGIENAIFIGHDFGASSAWNVAIRGKERVRGLVLLSVPYDPDRMKVRPSEIYAAMARKHFFHIHYFQEPGLAERELDARPREFIKRLFFALSGSYDYLEIWKHSSEGRGYLDVLPEVKGELSFLDDELLERYAEIFGRTGFAGGLSWYRAFDANWEEGEAFVGAKIEVPTLFIAGESDAVIRMRGPKALERMREFIPDLCGVHLLKGAGHFVQMERAAEVEALVLEFLRGL